MAEALTFAVLLLIAVILAARFFIAERRAARRSAEAERLARERREKERELQEKIDGLRNRDDRDRAAAAIARDPERAARVVKKMLKD